MSSYSYMRNQMMDLLDELSEVNPSEAPNYRMMIALRDTFMDHGVPQTAAELLVSHMKISVSAQAANDAELVRRVCEVYGKLVGDMYDTIQSDFNARADQVLVACASQFSIQMEF